MEVLYWQELQQTDLRCRTMSVCPLINCNEVNLIITRREYSSNMTLDNWRSVIIVLTEIPDLTGCIYKCQGSDQKKKQKNTWIGKKCFMVFCFRLFQQNELRAIIERICGFTWKYYRTRIFLYLSIWKCNKSHWMWRPDCRTRLFHPNCV